MSNLEMVSFVHANTGAQIYIVKNLIAGYYKSDAQQCTYIVSAGGAIFPAKEKVDEVGRKLGTVDVTTVSQQTQGESK